MRLLASGDAAVLAWSCSRCKEDPTGDVFRASRNCDGETSQNVSWPWAPGLRRCPWAVVTDEPEALECIGWWHEWKHLQVLPYGGHDLMSQPAYVVDAIRLCESVSRSIEADQRAEQARRGASL